MGGRDAELVLRGRDSGRDPGCRAHLLDREVVIWRRRLCNGFSNGFMRMMSSITRHSVRE